MAGSEQVFRFQPQMQNYEIKLKSRFSGALKFNSSPGLLFNFFYISLIFQCGKVIKVRLFSDVLSDGFICVFNSSFLPGGI